VNKLFSSSDKKAIFSALMAEDICKEMKITPRSLVAELVDRRLGQQARATPARPFTHAWNLDSPSENPADG
jgi:hypothetical protein